jgi:hypothetical protein
MIGRLMAAAAVTLALAVTVDVAGLQNKGRYKVQGDNCVWDANDSGPNQCTPRTRGRFKEQGGSCVWAANEDGTDQCKPPQGRWKTDGDRCVWDPKDSGPNQCNPRQPRQ